MTSGQQPVQYENYPSEPAASGSPPFGASAPTELEPVPEPTKSDGGQTTRRVVVGGGIAFIVLLGISANQSGQEPSGSQTEWIDPSFTEDSAEPVDEPADPVAEVNVGDYYATLPDGWQVSSRSENQAVITAGSNRVLARAFDSDAGAADAIAAAVKARLGAFKGELGEAEDVSFGDTDAARIEGSGKIGKKPAWLIGQLWIDLDRKALLVLQTLTAAPDSDRALEAQEIADQFSGGFE